MIALLVPVADAGQFFDAGHHGHAEHITMDAPPRTGRGNTGDHGSLLRTGGHVATLQRTTTMNKRAEVFAVPEFVEWKGSGVDSFLLF
jgi:hypothetical protein